MLTTQIKTHIVKRIKDESINITEKEYNAILNTDTDFIKLEDCNITLRFSSISAIEPIDLIKIKEKYKNENNMNISKEKWNDLQVSKIKEIKESKIIAYDIAPEIDGRKRVWQCESCKKWSPYNPNNYKYNNITKHKDYFDCKYCSENKIYKETLKTFS